MRLIAAASVAATPWRNGGGRTRELLVWPSAQDWRLRLSLADIEHDGPFSAFPRITRWFAVQPDLAAPEHVGKPVAVAVHGGREHVADRRSRDLIGPGSGGDAGRGGRRPDRARRDAE